MIILRHVRACILMPMYMGSGGSWSNIYTLAEWSSMCVIHVSFEQLSWEHMLCSPSLNTIMEFFPSYWSWASVKCASMCSFSLVLLTVIWCQDLQDDSHTVSATLSSYTSVCLVPHISSYMTPVLWMLWIHSSSHSFYLALGFSFFGVNGIGFIN